MKNASPSSIRPWLVRLLALLVLGLLVAWAVRHVPVEQIWSVLRGLRAWQIALLLAANAGLYLLVSLRWWLIVRAEARRVPFLPLVGVRVSVFGVSYFTLGPQVGGEPLQVLFLQRRYGLSFTRATASVLMDKLIEFLINFILLPIGLSAIFRAGVLSESRTAFSWELIGLVLLLLWPPVHIFLLYKHHYPLTVLVHALPFLSRKSKAARFVHAAEWLAGDFCRRHLSSLLVAVAVSLLAGAGMVAEYALMASFLGIHLPFWNSLAAWASGWLAFLFPLPGGLGALEASQVFVLGVFGVQAAGAVSMILMMRGRDLLIGGLGLLLAGTASWKS